jgi:SAM-dependent methyltransferase
MPHDRAVHHRRDRAESFGAVAAAYDRYRPSYPEQLIDDLMARRPGRVLDIGCGTGKATRLIAARGVEVTGVELDPQMAAVAREHGLHVEVGRFEEWDDRGRCFDLIIAAQSWHWVDPAVGGPKAARLLEPGGSLALFWNFAELAEDAYEVEQAVFRRLAPELVEPPGAGDDHTHLDALERTRVFGSIETHTYPGDRSWTIEEWVGNLGTQSNLLLLGRSRLAELLAELRAELGRAVDQVRTTGGTYLIRARL